MWLVLLHFFSGDCIAGEVSVSSLFLLSCERVESLGMDLVCSPMCFFFRVGGSSANSGISFWSLVPAPVMAESMLVQGFDNGGRYTPMTSSHAASKSWRPHSSSWLGSAPGRSGSSPTPAVQQGSQELGSTKDLGTFRSNSSFSRVLCVSFNPCRMCVVVCVVFSFFFRGLLVKDTG